MKDKSRELRQFLQGTLAELNKLADQIRRTKDYSEQAEYILTLRELIIEQIDTQSYENTGHTDHAVR